MKNTMHDLKIGLLLAIGMAVPVHAMHNSAEGVVKKKKQLRFSEDQDLNRYCVFNKTDHPGAINNVPLKKSQYALLGQDRNRVMSLFQELRKELLAYGADMRMFNSFGIALHSSFDCIDDLIDTADQQIEHYAHAGPEVQFLGELLCRELIKTTNYVEC
jgi:hypothetical protein